jgi:NAD(P)-dependent dehydrogenase (short-subunit alcohol dehydrogenase family)
VTGAGRGIGRELALALARAGAAVVVNDAGVALDGAGESGHPAEQVAAQIVAAGGAAAANLDSVTSPEGARAMVAACVERFGRVDFVVNNAGILRDRMFHRMSDEDWDAVLAVHLTGAFRVARAAAERFRAQGSGAVVNMTSTSGLIGNLGQANYMAAKLGVVGLTRAIALDMARFGVRANAVAPFAWTRMTAAIPDDGTPEATARRARLERLRPEQIAPLVVYLVSDAAREVSGQVFAVRGTEIVLFSQARPRRTLHRQGGWTPAAVADAMAGLASAFVPLEVTADLFPYDPPE